MCSSRRSAQAAPLILLMYPRSGLDGFPQRIAAGFAAEGFRVAVPEISHRQDPAIPIRDRKQYLKDAEIVADMRATLAFLRPGNGVFIMGHCMGGRHAFLGASCIPEITGAIPYYSADMFEAWGGTATPFDLLDRITMPGDRLLRRQGPQSRPGGCGQDRGQAVRASRRTCLPSLSGCRPCLPAERRAIARGTEGGRRFNGKDDRLHEALVARPGSFVCEHGERQVGCCGLRSTARAGVQIRRLAAVGAVRRPTRRARMRPGNDPNIRSNQRVMP